MTRVEHDTIPLDEGDKIWRLVKAYNLPSLVIPPPKPRPGSLSKDTFTGWETDDEQPKELPPWSQPDDHDAPQQNRQWGKFIPWWTELWVWHEGKAVVLKADYDNGRVLRRVVVKWVATEKKMRALEAEFNRCNRDGSLKDFSSLVEDVIPVDPNNPPRPRKPKNNFKSLKDARKKLEEASAGVRNEGFDAWVRRYVVPAKRPDEWTQATVLYENYVKHVRRWGDNRPDKRLSQLEMATETRFGIMMREIGIMKKRRRSGFFYPLRIKDGA